jgi:hypothetical protein
VTVEAKASTGMSSYIETIGDFLGTEDEPTAYIFPELLPHGVQALVHGEPRARKSLLAFELALCAALGIAPFGLKRFTPSTPVPTLYVMEEDPRALTRKRVRCLFNARTNATPENLYVAVRRGIDLDSADWVERIIADLKRLGVKLLVLDAARRLSALTDEGPQKVRELTRVLRSIVDRAGVTIVIVHHDVKPSAAGDTRRRSQRASGGDWFAASECPIHVERVDKTESMVRPEDYKFSSDPLPFRFYTEVSLSEDGREELVSRLIGSNVNPKDVDDTQGKVLAWLKERGKPASATAMQKSGVLGRWETISDALDALVKSGKVTTGPGRQTGSVVYRVAEREVVDSGSTQGSTRRDDKEED